MSLLEALMSSQDCSKLEAQMIIDEMRKEVLNGESPEELLYEYGLEPDYVFEIIDL